MRTCGWVCVFMRACVCMYARVYMSVGGGGGASRQTERVGETENSNSKTLFYKDCSLGSVKNLSNN